MQSEENLIPFSVLLIFLKQVSDGYTCLQVLALKCWKKTKGQDPRQWDKAVSGEVRMDGKPQ